MRVSTKAVVAVGVAGLAAASGAAFTGTGLTNTAGATQFVGGTVSQTVTGATLTNVLYAFVDTTNTAVDEVTLTFASATGNKIPAITLTGTTAVEFICTAIDGTTFKSVCTPSTAVGNGTSVSGVTAIDVTVS